MGEVARHTCPSIQNEPTRRATQARDSDPGAPVAITMTSKEGDRLVTTYATNGGPLGPYKANTFAEQDRTQYQSSRADQRNPTTQNDEIKHQTVLRPKGQR